MQLYQSVLASVLVLAVIHLILGSLSIMLGTVSTIQAVVWMAHRVSPIWSGGFFFVTGMIGIACVRRQTIYIILCFSAFSVVSLLTAVISIQLLRLGLVNHTTDGHTYQKDTLDQLLLGALGAAGAECVVCIVSGIISCRLAKLAKCEMAKKREGMFYVEVYGEKDVMVVSRSNGKVEKQLLDTSQL
uniref:Transmembrane protein 196 n=1 Tax=Macrostomum lignano TaxID=282301 RepID=A0A1I8GVV6_9PLAT